MTQRKFLFWAAGLIIGVWAFWGQGAIYAAVQQPDAGQTIEERKQPQVNLQQKQEAQLKVEEPERPPLQDSGEKIWVSGYRFSGQELVREAVLQKLVADSNGKWLTLAQIKELAARVTDYFRARGYLIARAYVPAQEIKDSVVEIAITIGRYDQIIIRKNVAIADNVVRLELGEVKSGAYIMKNSLERAIWLVNDLAGVEAKASLIPGGISGTSSLVLDLAPKGARVSGNVTADNYGNRFTGQYEVADYTAFNNPVHYGDLFTFYGASAGGGFTSGNLSYQLPVLVQGSKLELGYSRMGYALGEDFANLGAHGTAETFSAGYQHTFKRSRTGNLYGRIGFASKMLQDLTAGTTSDKSSKAVTAAIKGDGFDSWGGGGANSYSLSYTAGNLDIHSAADQAVDAGTAHSAGFYDKWNFTLARQQFISDRFSLMTFANGQWAGKNLDSSEKMSLGGANGVRAYPPGEAMCDQGVLGTAELRWTLTPQGNSKEKSGNVWQLAGFYDYGWAQPNKYPWTDSRNRSLQGAGLGLTWSNPGKATLKFYYAWKVGSEAAVSDTDANGRLWVQGIWYY